MKISSPQRPSTNQRRFGINVISNFLRTAVAGCTWIILTPFIISKIGIEAYGVVALAFSINKIAIFLSDSVRAPLIRFFTVAVKRGQSIKANRYFNTGLFSGLLLLGIGFIICPFLIPYSHFFFQVPKGYELQSGIVIAAGLVGALLMLIQSIFESIPFAQNRLDLVNLSLASKNIILLIGIISSFYILNPALWHVGLWFGLSGLGSLIIAFCIWKVIDENDLHINPICIRFEDFKDIFSMSGWIALTQSGEIFLYQINIFIVNAYLGAEVQGKFSAVQQWETVVRMGTIALSSALIPVLLEKYATKGKKALVQLSVQAVRWLAIALSFPVGILVGLGGAIMGIWLGPEYQTLAPLMAIMIGHFCFTAAFQPLLSIQVTLNKIRWPAVAALVSGLFSLVLAFWWVNWIPHLGLGVALAGVIGLSIKHIFFTPIYASKILEVSKLTFIKPVLPGIIGTMLVVFISYGGSLIWFPTGWLQLCLMVCIIFIPYSMMVFWIFLTAGERKLLCHILFVRK